MTIPYRAGSVSVTAGFPLVTGQNCDWLSGRPVIPGDVFYSNGAALPVATIISATSLTLELPWPLASAMGAAYLISPSQAGIAIASDIATSLNDISDLTKARIAGLIPRTTTTSGNIYRVILPDVSTYRPDIPVYWMPAAGNNSDGPTLFAWNNLPPLKLFKNTHNSPIGNGELNPASIYQTVYNSTLDGGIGGHVIVGGQGPAGVHGSKIYRQVNPPLAGDFNEGDFVVQVNPSGSFLGFFGPKTNGTWPPGIDFSAPAAAQSASALASANAAQQSLNSLNNQLSTAVNSATESATQIATTASLSASSSATIATQRAVEAGQIRDSALARAGESAASAMMSSASAISAGASAAAARADQISAAAALNSARALVADLLIFDDGIYNFTAAEIIDDGVVTF